MNKSSLFALGLSVFCLLFQGPTWAQKKDPAFKREKEVTDYARVRFSQISIGAMEDRYLAGQKEEEAPEKKRKFGQKKKSKKIKPEEVYQAYMYALVAEFRGSKAGAAEAKRKPPAEDKKDEDLSFEIGLQEDPEEPSEPEEPPAPEPAKEEPKEESKEEPKEEPKKPEKPKEEPKPKKEDPEPPKDKKRKPPKRSQEEIEAAKKREAEVLARSEQMGFFVICTSKPPVGKETEDDKMQLRSATASKQMLDYFKADLAMELPLSCKFFNVVEVDLSNRMPLEFTFLNRNSGPLVFWLTPKGHIIAFEGKDQRAVDPRTMSKHFATAMKKIYRLDLKKKLKAGNQVVSLIPQVTNLKKQIEAAEASGTAKSSTLSSLYKKLKKTENELAETIAAFEKL